MSWLSDLTGIHISAPPVIQNLGDNLLGLGLKAVPGGSAFGGVLIGGGSGPTAGQVVAQTGQNLSAQAQGAYAGASYVANQQASGYGWFLNNPLAVVALVVGVVLLLRRR